MMLIRSILIILSATVLSQVAVADDQPATQPAKVQPMDYHKLKEVMPDQIAGVKRSKNEGEKLSMAEFVMSKASAEYAKSDAGEKDPHATIEIVDYAASPQMAVGMTAWQSLQLDRESDSGFERAVKIKDQPAYETFQNDGQSGQINVFVGGRYLVTVQTTNVSADDLKKLADSLPIDKLLALK